MRYKTGVLVAFIICMLIIVLGAIYWANAHNVSKTTSSNIGQQEEYLDLKKAEELVAQSKPNEALNIILKYKPEIETSSESGLKWLDLFVKASEQNLNTQQLLNVYEYFPKSIESHEKASLLVADAFISTGNSNEYRKLRSKWDDRQELLKEWFLLDADNMVVEGKRKEAIDLLKSRSFEGKYDSGRLVRLALLYAPEEPKTAWEYLDLTIKKDPNNADIYSYRGKFLEAIGKNNLAQTEYLSAIKISPENLFLRDQLAEFYVRNRSYSQALDVWKEALQSSSSSDAIWLKAIFWSKVIAPLKFDWKTTKPPAGKLQPYVEYFLSLKPGQFWDNEAFDKIPRSKEFLKAEQASLWLRLIEALKQGNEKEATDLLQYNPFSSIAWEPQLELALRQVLMYRSQGSLQVDTSSLPIPLQGTQNKQSFSEVNQLPLFSQLNALSKYSKVELATHMTANLNELLLSPAAFSATFLSAGWMEAALALNPLKTIPESFPDWFAYGLAQAFRLNKGNIAALEFAALQKPTSSLSFLMGEIFIAGGNTNAGFEQLNKIAYDDSNTGDQAARLLSLLYIEKNEYEKAKEIILAHPRLEKDVAGQEGLARIALLQGNTVEADKLYTALEDKSDEAKSYLARKAFTEKNWKKARELTEQLLRQYPDNQILKSNLQRILKEGEY